MPATIISFINQLISLVSMLQQYCLYFTVQVAPPPLFQDPIFFTRIPFISWTNRAITSWLPHYKLHWSTSYSAIFANINHLFLTITSHVTTTFTPSISHYYTTIKTTSSLEKLLKTRLQATVIFHKLPTLQWGLSYSSKPTWPISHTKKLQIALNTNKITFNTITILNENAELLHGSIKN